MVAALLALSLSYNPTILVFTSDWCPHCQTVKNYAVTLPYDVKIIDYDTNSHLVRRYSISQVPTVIILENNRVVFRCHTVNSLERYLNAKAKMAILESETP